MRRRNQQDAAALPHDLRQRRAQQAPLGLGRLGQQHLGHGLTRPAPARQFGIQRRVPTGDDRTGHPPHGIPTPHSLRHVLRQGEGAAGLIMSAREAGGRQVHTRCTRKHTNTVCAYSILARMNAAVQCGYQPVLPHVRTVFSSTPHQRATARALCPACKACRTQASSARVRRLPGKAQSGWQEWVWLQAGQRQRTMSPRRTCGRPSCGTSRHQLGRTAWRNRGPA